MNYAVILAGGIGSRMKMDGMPKQYIEVEGKPILIYTLETFELNDRVHQIIVVADENWHQQIKRWMETYSITKAAGFALPGITRQGSIKNGINACLQFEPKENDIVIIHDAARPLVSGTLISDCIDTAFEYGGCMPVLPVSDTIYRSVNGVEVDGLLERSELFAGQAPEAFRLLEYAKLNNAASDEELNKYKGTSEIAYRHGVYVRLIEGDERNFKITTQKDLEKFEVICKEQER